MSHVRFSKKQSRLFVLFVCVIVVVSLLRVDTFHVKAEIAFFDALSVEQQIKEVELIHTQKPESVHEYIWSSFTGTVPPGAVVESMVFTLSWIQSVTTQSVENSEEIGGKKSDDMKTVDTRTPLLLESDTQETTEVEISADDEGNTKTESEIVEVRESGIYEEIHTEEVGIEVHEVTPSASGESENKAEESVDISTSEEKEIVDDESFVGFPQVSATTTYFLANEESTVPVDVDETNETEAKTISGEEQVVVEITEATVITASETLVPEVEGGSQNVPDEHDVQDVVGESDAYEVSEEISTSTLLMLEDGSRTEELSASTSVASIPTRESASLSYSFDGVEWFSIGDINLLTGNQISFDLGEISIEAVPSLRIRITYSAPVDAPLILFETPQLQLSYIPGEVVEVPAGPSDQEPQFESSFVMSDMTSENIRAVLLERGGMLEFWYSITDRQTGKALWRKLSGGGAIQEGAPIDIKKRTIFWFDRNKETLFGLSVDSGSVFATTYNNQEERIFRLPFETEGEEQWEATYDPKDNALQFEKISIDE